LSQRGVYLTDGAAFGARGFVRLNFCCSRETLEEGLERIKGACAEARSNL
jgi:cystathionine beta-lyase